MATKAAWQETHIQSVVGACSLLPSVTPQSEHSASALLALPRSSLLLITLSTEDLCCQWEETAISHKCHGVTLWRTTTFKTDLSDSPVFWHCFNNNMEASSFLPLPVFITIISYPFIFFFCSAFIYCTIGAYACHRVHGEVRGQLPGIISFHCVVSGVKLRSSGFFLASAFTRRDTPFAPTITVCFLIVKNMMVPGLKRWLSD